jgi:hypothetical protein
MDFESLPLEMQRALLGTDAPTAEVKRKSVAIFKPLAEDAEDAECFSALEPLEKLFAAVTPSACAGPSYIAEPRRFLGDDFSEEERADDDAIEPIRKIFREGIFYDGTAPAAQEPLEKRIPVTRENLPPTPEEDAPLQKRDESCTQEQLDRITKIIMSAEDWQDAESEQDYDERIARLVEPFL